MIIRLRYKTIDLQTATGSIYIGRSNEVENGWLYRVHCNPPHLGYRQTQSVTAVGVYRVIFVCVITVLLSQVAHSLIPESLPR